jgi:hypothetical protein
MRLDDHSRVYAGYGLVPTTVLLQAVVRFLTIVDVDQLRLAPPPTRMMRHSKRVLRGTSV